MVLTALKGFSKDDVDKIVFYMEGEYSNWKCTEPYSALDPPSSNEDCPNNKEWQSSKYFLNKGRINIRTFCSKYDVKRKCIRYLGQLEKTNKALSQLYQQQDALEEKMDNLEFSKLDAEIKSIDSAQTEMGCGDCIDKKQVAKGVMLSALGVGLSVLGAKYANNAQESTNKMLVWQGFSEKNNVGNTIAGVSLGLPFVAEGVHTMTTSSQNQYICEL